MLRYVYAVTATLYFIGGVHLLFGIAGVVFFVAGMVDLFFFHNQAAGLLAALAGLVCLVCGYMFGLWLDGCVRVARAEWRPSPATTPDTHRTAALAKGRLVARQPGSILR